jgi:hypothetical protein
MTTKIGQLRSAFFEDHHTANGQQQRRRLDQQLGVARVVRSDAAGGGGQRCWNGGDTPNARHCRNPVPRLPAPKPRIRQRMGVDLLSNFQRQR